MTMRFKTKCTIVIPTMLAGDVERLLADAKKCPIGLMPSAEGSVSGPTDHSGAICAVSTGFFDHYKPPESQDASMFTVYVVWKGVSAWTYGQLFHAPLRPVKDGVDGPHDKLLGFYNIENPATDTHYEIDVVSGLRDEFMDKNCPKCGVQVDRYALNGSLCENCRFLFMQSNFGD